LIFADELYVARTDRGSCDLICQGRRDGMIRQMERCGMREAIED
jgi:hypothetical protein